MYTEGALFDGRYLLKERKGRGSFGEVWLAEDTEIHVDFAIKIYVAMDPKGLDEFRKEYQLSCNLINSNLLHINKMEVCKDDGCPYLVMPYCPRGASSLAGQMSEADMWQFLHDVANGLAYLHEQNPPIIHQDIKPDNILQMQSGTFVITDFGISKQLRATRSAVGGDSSGAVAYMGPERFQRGYTSIKSSDIWSLGATLYEMATGLLPFEGKGGKMQDAGFETPILPGQFSHELDDVMQACMCKEPWDRPSARQLAEYAGEMMRGHAVQPPFAVPAHAQAAPMAQSAPVAPAAPVNEPVPASQQPLPSSSTGNNRNLLLGACGAAAILVIGLVVFLLMGNGDDAPEQPVDEQMVETVEQTSTPAVQTEVAEAATEEAAPVVVEQSSAESPVQASPEAVTTPSTSASASQPAQPTAKAEQPAASKPAVQKEEAAPKEKPSPSSQSASNGSLTLSYGKYTGSIKGGYPNGRGKLVYTTSRQINKYDSKRCMAEAGDYVEGLFVNGFFTTGKHYNAAGELLNKISVGVAEGAYESK